MCKYSCRLSTKSIYFILSAEIYFYLYKSNAFTRSESKKKQRDSKERNYIELMPSS